MYFLISNIYPITSLLVNFYENLFSTLLKTIPIFTMKSLFLTLSIISLFIVTGCHHVSDESFQHTNSKTADMVAYEVEEGILMAESKKESSYQQNEQKKNSSFNRKLIKEGSVSFETHDLNKSYQQVINSANNLGGYISSDQQDKSSYRTTFSITVRIPASAFDSLILAISQGVKSFDSKNIDVKDVTEEFFDIQVRLKNKKELEIRYLTLLKETKNISEILEIERALNQIRSEIESVEGRLKYLSDRISYSTLHITFYKTHQQEAKGSSFGDHFINGFTNGWHNLIWFFIGIINLWPFLLLIPLCIFSWKKWKNNKRKI